MSDPRPDWLDLSDEQIRSDVKALADEQLGPTPRGVPATFRVTVREFMALSTQRYFATAARPMAQHVDPRIATGAYLRWHGLFAGVPLRAARAAQGSMTLTSATGGRVRAGAVADAGGARFVVDRDVRLPAGVDTVAPVTAEATGAGGNVAAGTAVELVDPNPDDLVGRLDADWLILYGHPADDLSTSEGTERYRTRVDLGYTIRGDAQLIARYRFTALGVSGVSSASVGRAPRGAGSVDVAVLFGGLLPSDAQLDVVRAAIDEANLAGDDTRVVAPRIITVAVVATITGTAVTTDVEDAILAWWRANISIGAGVSEAALHAGATAGVAGITSINYSSPVADLPAIAAAWYSPSISVTRA